MSRITDRPSPSGSSTLERHDIGAACGRSRQGRRRRVHRCRPPPARRRDRAPTRATRAAPPAPSTTSTRIGSRRAGAPVVVLLVVIAVECPGRRGPRRRVGPCPRPNLGCGCCWPTIRWWRSGGALLSRCARVRGVRHARRPASARPGVRRAAARCGGDRDHDGRPCLGARRGRCAGGRRARRHGCWCSRPISARSWSKHHSSTAAPVWHRRPARSMRSEPRCARWPAAIATCTRERSPRCCRAATPTRRTGRPER